MPSPAPDRSHLHVTRAPGWCGNYSKWRALRRPAWSSSTRSTRSAARGSTTAPEGTTRCRGPCWSWSTSWTASTRAATSRWWRRPGSRGRGIRGTGCSVRREGGGREKAMGELRLFVTGDFTGGLCRRPSTYSGSPSDDTKPDLTWPTRPPGLSCPVLPCSAPHRPILSCPALSCPVLSRPVPVPPCPCPDLSCPVLPCFRTDWSDPWRARPAPDLTLTSPSPSPGSDGD